VAALEVPADAELFAGLDEDQRRGFAALAREREVRAGETLFRLGERADAFYVLREGRIELTFPIVVGGEAREARFQTLEAGRTLAWSALVPPHLLTLSARAATPARLVAFDGAAALRLLEAAPDAGRIVLANLSRVVASRFQEVLALYVREVQRGVSQARR
jgi:CRP-like cAMP-binding protein